MQLHVLNDTSKCTSASFPWIASSDARHEPVPVDVLNEEKLDFARDFANTEKGRHHHGKSAHEDMWLKSVPQKNHRWFMRRLSQNPNKK